MGQLTEGAIFDIVYGQITHTQYPKRVSANPTC
jgi:hypothetical protein